MSKFIDIDENVISLVPEIFKTLPKDDVYRLTKTENFRNWMVAFVFTGDTVKGPLSIVDVYGKPGVKVLNNANRHRRDDYPYIRTSPIVEVVDTTYDTITFRTEGGIYKLENLTTTLNKLTEESQKIEKDMDQSEWSEE